MKYRVLLLGSLLASCVSPLAVSLVKPPIYPDYYWTMENQLKIALSPPGSDQAYYQVNRDGSGLKTVTRKDFLISEGFASIDGKYSATLDQSADPDPNQKAHNVFTHKLVLTDTQSKKSQALADIQATNVVLESWSPDSKYLTLNINKASSNLNEEPLEEDWIIRANDLKVFKISTDLFKETDSDKKRLQSLSWSKDNQLLCLVSKGSGTEVSFEIWKIDPEASKAEKVKVLQGKTGKSFTRIEALSPDNTKMVLIDNNKNLYFADLQSGQLKYLRGGQSAQWALDSSQFAVQAHPAFDDPKYKGYSDPKLPLSDIIIFDSQGNQIKQITNTPDLNESKPTFSPDGKSLAFQITGNKEQVGVFTVNPDGSNLIKVSKDIVLKESSSQTMK